MRYELGALDFSYLCLSKTLLENNPCILVTLNEQVDGQKLNCAVTKCLNDFPLLKTEIIYDGKFYAQSNNKKVNIINVPFDKRPLEFGAKSNGYPWQITFYDNKIAFEWAHCITDGIGMLNFITDCLRVYFDLEPLKVEPHLDLGYESTLDCKEQCNNLPKQKMGFRAKSLPYNKVSVCKTKCHTLETSTAEILKISKQNGATPISLIAPLFSKALRQNLDKNAKNKNVKCSFAVDERRVFNIDTMHGFNSSVNVTYVDKYDEMEFFEVCKKYRQLINGYMQKGYLKDFNKKIVKYMGILSHIKPLRLLQKTSYIIAKILKHNESNFGITYFGKYTLPDEIKNKVTRIEALDWHDYGESNICAIDFEGKFILNITENYLNKNVVNDFINESKEIGVNWVETVAFDFTQPNYRTDFMEA